MKGVLAVVVLFCIAASSCSQVHTRVPIVSDTDQKDAKITFGMYDIAKSPSVGDLFRSQVPTEQRSVSANVPAADPAREEPAGVDNATAIETRIANNENARRKVIRDAEIHIQAAEPDVVQKQIASIAESSGGFVLRSEQSMSDASSGVRDSVTITIRVPSDRFDAAIDAIHSAGGTLLVEAQEGKDVTEEFVDLEARLRAKRALETQFVEIMKQAKTVAEALQVQTELSNVRTDIEKIEGRRRYLDDQAAFSTIVTDIRASASIAGDSLGAGYQVSASISNGLEAAFNFTLNLVTFVLGALPFILFVALPGYYAGRALWRRRSPKPGDITPTEPEAA